jgi:hypothetical protein
MNSEAIFLFHFRHTGPALREYPGLHAERWFK